MIVFSKFVVSRGKEVEIQNVHLIRQSPAICAMSICPGSVTVVLTGQIILMKFSHTMASFSSCQPNLIKTFQIKAMIVLITKMAMIFS
jgi:hypothetical protein